MTRYLLDTNIVSYLAKAAFPALDYRFRSLPPAAMSISSITEAEIRFGLALLPAEAKQHRHTESFLQLIRVEPWDSTCARQYALLAAQQHREGEKMEQADTMIAAHALAHGYTLITHDKAFSRVPHLTVEDWTEGPLPA